MPRFVSRDSELGVEMINNRNGIYLLGITNGVMLIGTDWFSTIDRDICMIEPLQLALSIFCEVRITDIRCRP